MNDLVKTLWILMTAVFAVCLASSCSKDEAVRTPADILGVWQTDTDSYLQFRDDNTARVFSIEYQDSQSIGKWSLPDVYFYEPGYELVIYLNAEHEANVFQIVELSDSKLTWCWVDEIDVKSVNGMEDIGSVVGDIIKKAQEGFTLNPELYESFIKIPELQFEEILESLDIVY